MFDTAPQLDCNGRILRLDRPRVMGIVNVTPDSFSDGGHHFDAGAAIAHGLQLAEEGADLLDIGGESTRPGAQEVTVEEELRRVVPVIEALAAGTTLPISIDQSQIDEWLSALGDFVTSAQFGSGAIAGVSAVASFITGFILMVVILFFFFAMMGGGGLFVSGAGGKIRSAHRPSPDTCRGGFLSGLPQGSIP